MPEARDAPAEALTLFFQTADAGKIRRAPPGIRVATGEAAVQDAGEVW